MAPGQTLVFTLTYGNTGESTATGVVITETVPVATTFKAADSTPGWSCADGSPAGTTCLLAVANVPGGVTRQALFAVVVDAKPSTLVIANRVVISDDGGGSSSGGSESVVGSPAPAPALSTWALGAALAALAGLARRRWR